MVIHDCVLIGRLEDTFCLIEELKMLEVYDIDSNQWKVISLAEALEDAHKKPADLTGYMALSDSILHLIMHAPTSSEDSASDSRREVYSYTCFDDTLIRVSCGQSQTSLYVTNLPSYVACPRPFRKCGSKAFLTCIN